jgi:hypothetical protein
MIRRYGEDAKIEAAMRADERLGAGDLDGQAVWMQLIKAIEELRSTEKPADSALH